MSQSCALHSIYQHHLVQAPDATMLIQGDHVAVWLVNRVEWFAIFFALARLGATLVAVNTKYRSHEVHYILANSQAQFLILQLNFRKIDFAQVVEGVDASDLTHLKTIMMVDADDRTPTTLLDRPALHFLPTLAKSAASSSSHPPKNFGDALLQRTATDSFKLTQLAAHAFAQLEQNPDATQTLALEDLPVIFFTTSGTTKGPKLVIHTQKTLSEHVKHIFLHSPPSCRSKVSPKQ